MKGKGDSRWGSLWRTLVGMHSELYTRARRALDFPGDSSDPGAVAAAALDSRDWPTRNLGVKLIARYRVSELYPRLLECLDPAGDVGIVRRNVAQLLPSVDWHEARARVLRALCRALSDPYWEVRAESARGLAGVARDSQARSRAEQAILERLAHERHFEVRAAFAEALGALGSTDPAFLALRMLLVDRSWLVRCQAAVALLELSNRRPDLLSLALDSVRSVNLLSDGAVGRPLLRERIRTLLDAAEAGVNGGRDLRNVYLRLREGWNRGP